MNSQPSKATRPVSEHLLTGPGKRAWRHAERRLALAAACRVVLPYHPGRDPPALTDRQAALLRPRPDITRTLTVGRRVPLSAGLCPSSLAGVLNVGRELLVERGGVLGAQVDFVVGALEGEPHGLIGRAAGEVVLQSDGYLLSHLQPPILRSCLHRIRLAVFRPAAAPPIRHKPWGDQPIIQAGSPGGAAVDGRCGTWAGGAAAAEHSRLGQRSRAHYLDLGSYRGELGPVTRVLQ